MTRGGYHKRSYTLSAGDDTCDTKRYGGPKPKVAGDGIGDVSETRSPRAAAEGDQT